MINFLFILNPKTSTKTTFPTSELNKKHISMLDCNNHDLYFKPTSCVAKEDDNII